MVLGQNMFKIRRKRWFWNLASLQPMTFQNFYDWHPYSCVVRMLLFMKRSVVLKLIFLLLQTFLRSANVFPALESLVSIFGSMFPSVAMLEPRYVKAFPSSTAFPCGRIGTSQRSTILMCLGFPALTLSPNSEAVDTTSQVVACVAVWGWAMREMSSAKSRSLSSW